MMKQCSHMLSTDVRRALQPLWNSFEKHLLPFCGGGVCLALSGGPDSRALLESFARWNPRSSGRVLCASVNHGIRKDAAHESEAVLKRARVLGFDTRVVHLQSFVGADEATLRKRRYAALSSIAEKYDLKYICTAHHQDDDSDGYLMNILGCGGGNQGAGMEHVAKVMNAVILRPFLGLSRKCLLQALSFLCIEDYIVDSSDYKTESKRSEVRYVVKPFLEKYHSSIGSRLAKLASNQQYCNSWIVKEAKKMLVFNGNLGDVFIPYKKDISKFLFLGAVRYALCELCPGKDLRNASSVLEKVFNLLQSLQQKQRQGLDLENEFAILQKENVLSYNLPGAKALVFFQGIVLNKEK